MKVIKSLDNRGILLNWTTTKMTSQERNVLKRVLIPLGLSAGMSAADPATQKKIYGSSTTALIILNEEIEDLIKIIK